MVFIVLRILVDRSASLDLIPCFTAKLSSCDLPNKEQKCSANRVKCV